MAHSGSSYTCEAACQEVPEPSLLPALRSSPRGRGQDPRGQCVPAQTVTDRRWSPYIREKSWLLLQLQWLTEAKNTRGWSAPVPRMTLLKVFWKQPSMAAWQDWGPASLLPVDLLRGGWESVTRSVTGEFGVLAGLSKSLYKAATSRKSDGKNISLFGQGCSW